MEKHIKTVCGIQKYKELSCRQGIFNRIRFYWFVVFAVIRDFGKEREEDTAITMDSGLSDCAKSERKEE